MDGQYPKIVRNLADKGLVDLVPGLSGTERQVKAGRPGYDLPTNSGSYS